jgi:hypothetical protein
MVQRLGGEIRQGVVFWLEWGLREVGRWGTLVALFL